MSDGNEKVQLSSPRNDDDDENGKTVGIPIVNETDQDGCLISIQIQDNDDNRDGKEEAKKDDHDGNEKTLTEESNKVAGTPPEPTVNINTDEKNNDQQPIPDDTNDNNNDNNDNDKAENNFVVVNEEFRIDITPEDCSEGKEPLKWGSENYSDNEEDLDDYESDGSDYSSSSSGSDSDSDSDSDDDDDDDKKKEKKKKKDAKKNEEEEGEEGKEKSEKVPPMEVKKWKSCSALKVNRGKILSQCYRYPVVASWTTGVKPEKGSGKLLEQKYRLPQPIPIDSPTSSKSPPSAHHKHERQESSSKPIESTEAKETKEVEEKTPKSPSGDQEERKPKGKDSKDEKKEKKGDDSKPKDTTKTKDDKKSKGKDTKEEKETKEEKKPKEDKKAVDSKDTKDEKKSKDTKEDKKVSNSKDEKKSKKKPVIFKAPKPIESKKLRFTAVAYSGRGRRKTNEDTHVIIEDLQKDAKRQDRLSFFAVYDGHGGSATSEACKEVVHRSVIEHPLFGSDTEAAIREGFAKADKEFNLPEGDKSGSTAVVGFLHGKTLYVADLGDSECVIGVQEAKSGPFASELLSKKHKPTDPDEKARIEKEGGMVVFGRIYGTLAVSRGFGDYEFKHSDGMYVSCEPYIRTRNLSRKDKFVIFACDGLWDKVTYEEAVIHVSLMLGRKKPEEIVESLYELSFGKGSLDNITIVLVIFEWG